NRNATLILKFEVFNQQHQLLSQHKLPLYLDAISNFPLQLLDTIFKSDTQFSFKYQAYETNISNPFEVMGFAEEDSLLPVDQHTHQAYRLLTEYFCFPEKFNFLNINLDFLKAVTEAPTEFELKIHFKANLNDQAAI
ncbi:type VI secretion system baseplate subunit TssF, partial [Acinetobacter bohemicus]|uniref:type VI secretion system baseplate subunit TssF n=2 Tax=Acinetobacter TaxID=469 RepID=UPI0021D438A5